MHGFAVHQSNLFVEQPFLEIGLEFVQNMGQNTSKRGWYMGKSMGSKGYLEIWLKLVELIKSFLPLVAQRISDSPGKRREKPEKVQIAPRNDMGIPIQPSTWGHPTMDGDGLPTG